MNNTTKMDEFFDFDIDPNQSVDLLYNPNPVLIGLYAAVMLVSFVANSLLIIIILKHKYCKKNVTNIYLMNLSMADLLVTSLCMPIQLSKAVTLVWFYGEVVCKIVNYLQGVAVAASVFTIAVMSVDRYLAISPATSLHSFGRKTAVRHLIYMWAGALLTFFPLLIVVTIQSIDVPLFIKVDGNSVIKDQTLSFCIEDWTKLSNRKHVGSYFGIFSFTIVYALPGTITMISYIRVSRTLCYVKPPCGQQSNDASLKQSIRVLKERKRLAWVLLLVAGIFAACWMPYNIILLLLDIRLISTFYVSAILPYTLLLGHLNSAVNPIVYYLMTKSFQVSIRRLFCGKPTEVLNARRCQCICRRRNNELSSSEYEPYQAPLERCFIQMDKIDTRVQSSNLCPCSAPATRYTARYSRQRVTYAQPMRPNH